MVSGVNLYPYHHLCDIRSFTMDYNMLDNYYSFDFNEQILLNDLILFCNNNRSIYIGIGPFFYSLFSRNIILGNKSYKKLQSYIIKNFHNELSYNIDKKIKLLWGLFTPLERTSFINEFIIPNF